MNEVGSHPDLQGGGVHTCTSQNKFAHRNVHIRNLEVTMGDFTKPYRGGHQVNYNPVKIPIHLFKLRVEAQCFVTCISPVYAVDLPFLLSYLSIFSAAIICKFPCFTMKIGGHISCWQ